MTATLCLALLLSGADAPLEPTEAEEVLYQQVLPATLLFLHLDGRSSKGRWFQSATGVLIDREHRLVATNLHVVEDRPGVRCFFPSIAADRLVTERKPYFEQFDRMEGSAGKVVASRSRCDLAIVQLDSLPESAAEVPLARRGAVPGDRLYSIGNPGDEVLWQFKTHVVKSAARERLPRAGGGFLDALVITTEGSGKKGESGSPLVNADGELVGIAQGIREARDERVFIDLREIRDLLLGRDRFAPIRFRRPRQ